MNEMLDEELEEKTCLPFKLKLVGIATVIVLIFIVAIVLSIVFSRPGKMITKFESSIMSIDETEIMSTAEYKYNSVVEVKDEKSKKEKILYCVSYNGVVKSGFNFTDIKFETDTENKKYVVIIPEITVQSSEVEYESMQYIFLEGKDREGLADEAYEKCKSDLKVKTEENISEILSMAKESAKTTMESFLLPFKNDLKNGYQFEIRFEEEQK